jgi:hypothetical protein
MASIRNLIVSTLIANLVALAKLDHAMAADVAVPPQETGVWQ